MPKKIQNSTLRKSQTSLPAAAVVHAPELYLSPTDQKIKLQSIHHQLLLPGLTILAAIGIASAGLVYTMYAKEKTALQTSQAKLASYEQDPSVRARQESVALVQKVGSLVSLPQDEQPTIATITDLAKLKDQPFFAHAAIADKVLIFTNAKKAILYRPAENKIIEIAPLNLSQNQNSAATAASAAGDPTISSGNSIGQADTTAQANTSSTGAGVQKVKTTSRKTSNTTNSSSTPTTDSTNTSPYTANGQ